MKNFFRLITIVLGFAIIVGGFLLFKEYFEERVLWLDIIAACAVYGIAALYLVFPLIGRDDEAGKDVGMLGINITFLYICSFVSIAMIAVGIISQVSFKIQLIVQICALFILCMGKFLSLHTGEQVERVYHQEHVQLSGKRSVREAAAQLLSFAEINGLSDATLLGRLRTLAEETRYVVPSTEQAATNLDNIFCRDAESAVGMLAIPEATEQLSQLVDRMERTLQQRKRH